MTGGADEIRVEVVGLVEDEEPGELLEGEGGGSWLLLRDPALRELRVPINYCERLAIAVSLSEHLAPRPLTHDLGLRLLAKFSAELERVVIDDVREDSYSASLHLRTPTGELSLPALPGDAIALALRAEAPLFVTDEVFLRSEPRGESET